MSSTATASFKSCVSFITDFIMATIDSYIHSFALEAATFVFASLQSSHSYLRETRNGSSVQKAEHRAVQEILRKHLGVKHRWIRTTLLRLLSTPFRFILSMMDDGA
jgi:hypothetical protein